MAQQSRLNQVLTFANVASGAIVALPHSINVNSVPLKPDFVFRDNGDFSVVSCTTTTLTVKNNGTVVATLNAWLLHQHTFDREYGSNATMDLSPQPFIPATGGIGGGASSSIGASNVLTFRPGSTDTGPVVFNNFNDLYAQLVLLRTAADQSGLFKIVFDDTAVGGGAVVLNSGAGAVVYDMINTEWVGVHVNSSVLLEVKDGGAGGDSLVITNALWFANLIIVAKGQSHVFTPLTDQNFTLKDTNFGRSGSLHSILAVGAVTGVSMLLLGESSLVKQFGNAVYPISIGATSLSITAQGPRVIVDPKAFTDGGAGGGVSFYINDSAARVDQSQPDVTSFQPTMGAASGFWNADPNGVVSATKGTLVSDENTGLLWRNTDGATTWTSF